jgi:hypothetical protein
VPLVNAEAAGGGLRVSAAYIVSIAFRRVLISKALRHYEKAPVVVSVTMTGFFSWRSGRGGEVALGRARSPLGPVQKIGVTD